MNYVKDMMDNQLTYMKSENANLCVWHGLEKCI